MSPDPESLRFKLSQSNLCAIVNEPELSRLKNFKSGIDNLIFGPMVKLLFLLMVDSSSIVKTESLIVHLIPEIESESPST